MINTNIQLVPNSFNHFINLDSIETRIINYLKNTKTEEAERIWKLLKYSDMQALYKDNLTAEQKDALIYKDADEMGKRVFNFPWIEDKFAETCSLLKVYVYNIQSKNHLISTVNVGIDILSHNKLSNVYNDLCDPDDNGRIIEENITVKNRNTVLLRSILCVLNGANIEGVGVLQFNGELSEYDKAAMKLSNDRDFYGYQLIMSCNMASLGRASNG